MLLDTFSSSANSLGMAEENEKSSKLEQWQQDDAQRLRSMYDAYRKLGGKKQEEFAPLYGLKSQSNMGHYLHARRPLNLRAAIGFARGLAQAIEAFSPTIAAEIEEAAPLARNGAQADPKWPFPDIPPADYYALGKKDRDHVEATATLLVQKHRTNKLVHAKPRSEMETDQMPLRGKRE